MQITLGILQAGEMPDEVAEQFASYPQMFVDFFAPAGGDFEWRVFDARQRRFPSSPDECDGYLITGSAHGAYEDLPWIGELGDFIVRCRRRQKPLAGVCFGHQIIAQALGGQVVQSPDGWGLGLQEWNVMRNASWMSPSLPKLKLLSIHQDQVVQPPPGAQILAGSKFCPIAAYCIGDAVFCVQGHPEFTPGYARALYQSRRQKFAEPDFQAAMAGTRQDNDSRLVADWLTAFFVQAAAKN